MVPFIFDYFQKVTLYGNIRNSQDLMGIIVDRMNHI